jgi:hypothetical protein
VDALVVEFVGEEYAVQRSEQFTFGRNGDLEIDANPYLHRLLGVFAYDTEHGWTLYNVGSSIAIDLSDSSSTSRMTVAPGTSVALSFEESILTFSAGPQTYELGVEVPQSREDFALGEPPSGTQTISVSDMLLTPDQRLCLVGLAETRLVDRSAGAESIPTNRQVAARLGWKITKFNRKLDNVCDKFARAGVSGLRGDSSSLAIRRRERLVDHALTVGILTETDLDLLS